MELHETVLQTIWFLVQYNIVTDLRQKSYSDVTQFIIICQIERKPACSTNIACLLQTQWDGITIEVANYNEGKGHHDYKLAISFV